MIQRYSDTAVEQGRVRAARAGGSRGPPLVLSNAAHVDKVKSVRITAAPNTALFDGGVRYLQNNVTIEQQPQP